MLNTNQPPHHKTCHRYVDEGFSGSAKPFVILAHSPVLAQPCERALHHPAAGQHLKPTPYQQLLPVRLHAFFGPLLCPSHRHLLRDRLRRPANDLDAQTQDLLDPSLAPTPHSPRPTTGALGTRLPFVHPPAAASHHPGRGPWRCAPWP